MSKKITIETCAENSAYWASRPYLGAKTRASIAVADVLLVPQEGFRGEDVRSFPVGTESFYSHLRDKLGDKHVIDLAIEEEEYKELALHSALIVLGTLVLKYVVAPIAVKVVADYIGQKLRGEAKKEAATVRFEMIVQEETASGIRAVKISYDGPALEFQQAMEGAIKQPPSAIVVDAVPAAPAQVPALAEKKPDAKS